MVFADIYKNMSQYQIISICQRTINIINCAQEGASLTTKQGAVKEKMRICFNINVAQTKWIQSILKTMFELVLTLATFYLIHVKSKKSNLSTTSNRLPYYRLPYYRLPYNRLPYCSFFCLMMTLNGRVALQFRKPQ